MASSSSVHGPRLMRRYEAVAVRPSASRPGAALRAPAGEDRRPGRGAAGAAGAARARRLKMAGSARSGAKHAVKSQGRPRAAARLKELAGRIAAGRRRAKAAAFPRAAPSRTTARRKRPSPSGRRRPRSPASASGPAAGKWPRMSTAEGQVRCVHAIPRREPRRRRRRGGRTGRSGHAMAPEQRKDGHAMGCVASRASARPAAPPSGATGSLRHAVRRG